MTQRFTFACSWIGSPFPEMEETRRRRTRPPRREHCARVIRRVHTDSAASEDDVGDAKELVGKEAAAAFRMKDSVGAARDTPTERKEEEYMGLL